MKTGKGRPVVGRGAVQLLARYSYLDLLSGSPVLSPSSGARAGVENDLTLGLVWYLNLEWDLDWYSYANDIPDLILISTYPFYQRGQ